MRIQLQQQNTIRLISSILIFIASVYLLWTAYRVWAPPITFGTILYMVCGILSLAAGYLMLQREHLETAMFTSMIFGLVLTLWFYMTEPLGLKILLTGVFPTIAGLLAILILPRARKQIWIRRIKGFWEDFSHNKIGIAGLAILVLYIAVAILQPRLATYDPEQPGLANSYAMPEWIAIFKPELSNLPRTTNMGLFWENSTILPNEVSVEHEANKWTVRYMGNQSVVVPFHITFSYQYAAPEVFSFSFLWQSRLYFDGSTVATARYSMEINLTTPDGRLYPLWDQHWWKYRQSFCDLTNPEWKPGDAPATFRYPGMRDYDPMTYPFYAYAEIKKKWGHIPLWSLESTQDPLITNARLPVRLGYKPWEDTEVAHDLFSTPGDNYTLQLYMTFKPIVDNAMAEITFTSVHFHVPGQLHGLMGTEFFGRDVWSRVVYGARVSIAVGLAAAVISVLIGLVVGVASGYFGGIIDESLMRIVDILICLPGLPLLMILVTLFGKNVLYIILLISIFGWLGVSRIIRARVLSLRESPFIESARASGASSIYIMFRHLVPNVMPIVISDLILSVPGAILTEAALSFIGFGDPSTPTWGREFSLMQTLNAWGQGAWWWIIPPGLAITLLCVGFVFLGHAVDEIVNPKLRRRR